MKHLINTTMHGIGGFFILVGFILCLGAAGNSDLGIELSEVFRLAMAGMAICICGAFLAWWRV